MMSKKILFLTPYPLGKAPSQRFRFEFFLDKLKEGRWKVDQQSFISEEGWQVLYKEGNQLKKLRAVLSGFVRRKLMLFRANRHDYIFIHRELTPFGPPIFEWFLAKVLRKKIIYDFDDAIWLNDGHDGNPLWTWLKWRSKIAMICRWSWKVSAGNEYLADYAKQFCKQVEVVPTVVDTERHSDTRTYLTAGRHSDLPDGRQAVGQSDGSDTWTSKGETEAHKTDKNLARSSSKLSTIASQLPVVGWTGSHSTLFYLDMILPILQQLEKDHEFTFLVIANRDPKPEVKNYQFIRWSKENEVHDLSQIDIGIMPLEDTEWAKGKCGFKLIQYGAMGIPSIASPVGTNLHVIQENETGLFASSPKEWYEKLKKLLQDSRLRTEMGAKAREWIVKQYSVESLESKFLALFE